MGFDFQTPGGGGVGVRPPAGPARPVGVSLPAAAPVATVPAHGAMLSAASRPPAARVGRVGASPALIPDPGLAPLPQVTVPAPGVGVGVAGGEPLPAGVGLSMPSPASLQPSGAPMPAWATDQIKAGGYDAAKYTMSQGGQMIGVDPHGGWGPREWASEAANGGQAAPGVGVASAPAPAQASNDWYTKDPSSRRGAVADLNTRFAAASAKGDWETMRAIRGESAALDQGGFEGQARYAAEQRATSGKEDMSTKQVMMTAMKLGMTPEEAMDWAKRLNQSSDQEGAPAPGSMGPIDINTVDRKLAHTYPVAERIMQVDPKTGTPADLSEILENLRAAGQEGLDDPNSDVSRTVVAGLKTRYGTNLKEQLDPQPSPMARALPIVNEFMPTAHLQPPDSSHQRLLNFLLYSNPLLAPMFATSKLMGDREQSLQTEQAKRLEAAQWFKARNAPRPAPAPLSPR